jgi:hypothetical protein
MAYFDSRGFTDSQDNQKDFNEKYIDSDPGPYIATVKTTADPLRMGRLGVNITALTNTLNPKPNQITWCHYLSPFYGVKSLGATSNTDPYSFKDTQQSYGMWAVPPDIDTTVLVIFAKGDNLANSAFWMGCVQDPMTNQMVPGNGATDKTRVAADGTDFSQNKQQIYGTDVLPAGEKNRKLFDAGETVSSASKWNYPINDILANQMTSQGLIQDQVRGTTSSSARRESPSQVFGWNTPGRIRADSRTKNIGLDGAPVRVDRETGHSFVMDDGAEDGTNQLTRLRTASGHQLLMHDTEGVVYLANGSGKAWIEMDKNGKISIYSDKGIDIRAEGDFNLHADDNINFHAGKKIKFTAEENVVLNAEKYVYVMGESGILNASQKGSVRHFARDGITSHSKGIQFHSADGRIDLASGSQVHLNSVGPRAVMGPGWLKPTSVKVGIKETKKQDVIAQQPMLNGKVNYEKVKVKTTVEGFVTHEPYTRPAGGRDKDDRA